MPLTLTNGAGGRDYFFAQDEQERMVAVVREKGVEKADLEEAINWGCDYRGYKFIYRNSSFGENYQGPKLRGLAWAYVDDGHGYTYGPMMPVEQFMDKVDAIEKAKKELGVVL